MIKNIIEAMRSGDARLDKHHLTTYLDRLEELGGDGRLSDYGVGKWADWMTSLEMVDGGDGSSTAATDVNQVRAMMKNWMREIGMLS